MTATTFGEEVFPTLTVPKLSEAGEIDSGKTAVPLNVTVCGESGALSVIASEPVIVPGTAGVNVTPAWHDAPGASVDPQVVVVIEKFPDAFIEAMETGDELVFLNEIALAALVVPTT